ncbi:expressed protein [Chlorella variabilis]|uniref:Expressed protein n=1 Tax=Chlorella variabilis TaxID=554065 RepID=E1ZJY3_CHLVA|nr:expressed protein [Chlorella variabilis]EFN53941.1 expressed protein [Chlorella variabilis]|eukprot:XP_005846043.1 expressed protein [Chlorella variabilis]
MARHPAGLAAPAALLLILAAGAWTARAASDCPYMNTSEPVPATWNFQLSGPLVDDFMQPDMMGKVPGWLTTAFEASDLFTIDPSLTFGTYEYRDQAEVTSPYASYGAIFNLTSPASEIFGQDVIDELIPNDEIGVFKRQFFHVSGTGSHVSAVLSFVDYEALNITEPTTLSSNSSVDFAFYVLGCTVQIPQAFTFSTTPPPPGLSITDYEDVAELLPSFATWVPSPDSVANTTSPGFAFYQYWPLVVKASGEPIPVFVRLVTTLNSDSLEAAKQGVNSSGTGFDIYWLAGDEVVAEEAGLEASLEEVHANLAAVLNRLNDTMNGGGDSGPAPAPAPQPASGSAIGAAAGTPMLMALALATLAFLA